MESNDLFMLKSQFAYRQVGNETILVPLRSKVSEMNELFTLNEVGSFIWHQINGSNTENDIVNAVVHEFDVDKVTAANDVSVFLFQLEKQLG